jgi:tRNA(Ile)-lysidine synthase TilS/MesJ
MQCTICRREAIVFQLYSGKHLCPVHFTKDVEVKAKRTIRKHSWMHRGDHIAIALSGDAASTALLFFLSKLTANRRDIRLSAITIDPGIDGYPVLEYASKTAAACGVELFTGSFMERYKMTIDELFKGKECGKVCRFCQVLKKDLIGELAQEYGITSCAIATTVDEIAIEFFTDLLNGTVEHTLFSSSSIGTKLLPAIQPFIEIPATETNQYANLHSSSFGSCTFLPPCPYAGSSTFAVDAQKELDGYNSKHPATKFALANLAGTLAGIAAVHKPSAMCPVCGGTIRDGICDVCDIRRRMIQGTLL